MTADPNADLVGERWHHGRVTFIVTGTAPWSRSYVNLDSEDGEHKTCMQAALLRRALRERVESHTRSALAPTPPTT